MSILELDNKIPVKPPNVNRKINPRTHRTDTLLFTSEPYSVIIHLNTLIPVGTAIIMVAVVKKARVSTSIPMVNIWWAHTTNPIYPIPPIA